MVTDVERARRFYGEVVGWETKSSGGEFADYFIASRDGKAAAGLGPVNEGAPPAWTVYMASDDVEAACKAVEANSGTIVVPAAQVGDAGRMAIAADPNGAVFGIWEAKDFIGAEIYNEPGGLTWEDARCSDPARAREFYSGVFGYTYGDIPGMDDYKTFGLAPDYPLGGIGAQWDSPRPQWLAYFSVESTDDAVAAAAANGGSIVRAAEDTPYGRMATLADPDGCWFAVIQPPA